MAHLSEAKLLDTLNNVAQGNARTRQAIKNANTDLVDSLYQTEIGKGTTTSGSHLVNIEVIQPANTVIEQITVVTSKNTNKRLATGTTGFSVGTSEGGGQIVAGVLNAIPTDAVEMAPGSGSSTATELATALAGPAPLVLVPSSGYTSAARTLYGQVSHSLEASTFDDNNGEFTMAVKFIKL